jgi:hypothetical protein
LSDVTKQISVTGCKQTSPIKLTANSAKERSASNRYGCDNPMKFQDIENSMRLNTKLLSFAAGLRTL